MPNLHHPTAHDKTVLFRLVGVGGVYWALSISFIHRCDIPKYSPEYASSEYATGSKWKKKTNLKLS